MENEDHIEELFLQGKKRAAFEKLVSAYSPMLFNHIIKMTGNEEDAHDILQNTFLKAWKAFDKFQLKSKFGTWLFRIASNESYTFLSKRKHNLDLNNSPPQITKYLSNDNDPAAILAQAMELLPPKQKQVFVMRYFDELKYQSISEILGTSEGALKASYHQAVSKIEKFIKQL